MGNNVRIHPNSIVSQPKTLLKKYTTTTKQKRVVCVCVMKGSSRNRTQDSNGIQEKSSMESEQSQRNFYSSVATMQYFLDEEDLRGFQDSQRDYSNSTTTTPDATNETRQSLPDVDGIHVHEDRDNKKKKKTKTKRRSSLFLQELSYKSCLRSSYALRTQMFITFGVLAVLSMAVLSGVAIGTSRIAGDRVKESGQNALQSYTDQHVVHQMARYTADIIDAKLTSLHGLSLLLQQVTNDRFRGYPHAPGYANDTLTPFSYPNTTSRYPIQPGFIPFDGQLPPTTIDASNAVEHLRQVRVKTYRTPESLRINTDTASLFVAGLCGRSGVCHNSTTKANATDTPTFASIHERASDYATPLLKSLYEYHGDAQFVGIYFANDGAGAPVTFPGFYLPDESTYTSIGCDWMNAPNPYDPDRPIATPQQIARCHTADTVVSTRNYNPLERAWCREQALHPFGLQAVGPYQDAFFNEMIMTFGQAMYDPVTKEFLACTLIDVSVERWTQGIEEIRTVETGAVVMVHWEDGSVVAAHRWNGNQQDTLSATSHFVDTDTYNAIKRDWENDQERRHEPRVYRTANGRIASGSPVPPDDDNPQFMIIVSIAESFLNKARDDLDEDVDKEIQVLIRNILIAGLVGIAWVLVMLAVVSLYLTHPLRWMRQTGERIVRTAGMIQKEPLNLDTLPWSYQYAPHTEITKLVDQFRKMVKRFAGDGTAKLFKKQRLEVRNPFEEFTAFERLYQSRSTDKSFDFNYTIGRDAAPKQGIFSRGPREEASPTNNKSRRRLHMGPNSSSKTNLSGQRMSVSTLPIEKIEERTWLRSPLFKWILACITLPLILSMCTILVYVVWETSVSLPALIDQVERAYVDFEIDLLLPVTRLRAHYISELVSMSARDLQVNARFLGWVHFKALNLTDAIPPIVSKSEECKYFPANECPLPENAPETTCDCAWNDPWGAQECKNYSFSRPFQQSTYFGLREDAFANGDRNLTRYPSVAASPNTTEFWGPIDQVAGASEGLNASGYETTYARLRALAAMSIIQIPLYNYGTHKRINHPSWGSYIGYQADGMFAGYAGCEQSHTVAAHFQSTVSNRAFEINPVMCPENKYG